MPGKAFERALERFRNKLTEEQHKQFKASSLDDVNAEIQAIQSRLGSMKKMRSLNRLSKFLEAMSQIEQLVQVFLNVSEVVAFVWGPIKLALLVAGTRVEILECLLDTYVEVGEVIPSLRQYDELFGAAPLVLEVLEKYFCDILEFHHNALDVFARPGKTHTSTARPETNELVPKSMDKILRLDLEDVPDKSSRHFTDRFDGLDGHIEEVYTKLSSQIYDMQQSSKAEKAIQHGTIHLQEMNSIISKLDPPHVDGDQSLALNSCHSKSGEWLFQNPAYLRWAGSETLPDSVLFIHGMPGAGKTLLASRIISHLRPLAGAACLFFYFKQSENTKRSMGDMLRALLVQLIRQDNSLVLDLYRKCSLVSNTEARQLPTLQNWLMEVLESQATCSIALDGLDEYNYHGSGDEARKILDWFISTVIPHCSRVGAKLRLLALGQRDGVVDSALSGYSSISLDYSAAHLDDIQSFARSRALELSKRLKLDEKEESNIIQKVTTTAKGMFPYAKVVMDNLIAQGSLYDLDQELGIKFPSGLDQAYERVVFRVLDSPARHQSQREAAAKVIRWLTCAVRPLRWNEIQALFCIDPYKGDCNPRCRRVDSCKALCGSFVEVDEHDPSLYDSQEISPEVSLVHDRARRYLFQAHLVDEFEGNADMAILSSAYLASLPFCKGEDILAAALTGYYGLQDYMVSSWQNHLALSFEQRSRLSPETTEKL
ncbi:hypothetical protein GGR55DRAFT_679137 [Xylaria sp. FL0064]|nr:hypothetical protein GGR55DRAFT_679137 [Xylaria sp. FL0064]